MRSTGRTGGIPSGKSLCSWIEPKDLSGNRAKPSSRANPAPVTPSAFGGGIALSRYGQNPPRQMSRRPLARRWFAGRSRPRWSSPGGSSLARQIAPLGHALRRADPPAVRSPAPGNTGSAAPGRPCAPGASFAKLSFAPSAPGLGLASAPVWGWRGPNLAPAVICFGCHPHTCARV